MDEPEYIMLLTSPQVIDPRIEAGTGKWRITTWSQSQYEIDLDEMTFRRSPGPEASNLRRDGDTFKLLSIITCVEGVLGEFMIDLREDGISTYRRTTAIEKIEEVCSVCGEVNHSGEWKHETV
jgi:hypothetical protein